MDEKERKRKQDEDAIQQELERQLRDLGVTVSDAFRQGFQDYGDEIGRQAAEVGRSFTHLMNDVVGEVDDALRDAFNLERGKARRQNREERRRRREAARNGSAFEAEPYDYTADFGGQPGRARTRWDSYARPETSDPIPDYEKTIRWNARKRFGIGLAMVICFGVLIFAGFLGSLGCFMATDMLWEGTLEYTVVLATGFGLMGIGIGSVVGTVAGSENLEASKLLNRCADAFAAMDVSQGVYLDDLAGLLQMKKRKLRKRLRELIEKGWLAGWLDEKDDCLYLSAADYRAAHNIPPAPAAEKQPEPEKPAEEPAQGPKTLHLDTARRFAHVLAEERRLMTDPTAADELEKMQQTTESICAWLESHPESAPKARRFAEYYIPTTLKLLHTYNDVQGQKGDNAEAIRRDIGGILHTLNTAYENLYDTLLSDAALDVSSEIAALEGMLASDGLTGEGLR